MFVSLEILLNVLSRRFLIRSATIDETSLWELSNLIFGWYWLDCEPSTPSAIKSNVGRDFTPTLDNKGFRLLLTPLLPVNFASLDLGGCLCASEFFWKLGH